MTLKTFLKSSSFQVVTMATLVAVITLRDADCLITPSIDNSFRWALNYFLAFHRHEFIHIIYPAGPLCIIKWPAPLGDHIFINSLIQLFLNFLFTFLLTRLYLRQHNNRQLIAPLLISTLFLMIVNIDYVLLGCIAAGILSWKHYKEKIPLLCSVLLSAVACYTKSSLLVFAMSIWFVFAINLIINKQFKVLLYAFIAVVACYLLIGILLWGSIADVIRYSTYTLLIPFSYSDALSMYINNNWLTLALSLICLLTCIILFAKQPGGFAILLLSFCMFTNWKYAIGREDFFHALSFTYLLVLATALFLAVQATKITQGTVLLLLSICFYNYNLININSNPQYFWFPGFTHFSERVLSPHAFKENIAQQSYEECKDNILPAEWQNEIGNASVDIFPWDLSIAMVNSFNYHPRPSLQSPPINHVNEKIDIDSLISATGPQYIIWHKTRLGKLQLDGLNNEYLPSACPKLTEAILTNYSPTKGMGGKLVLFKKRAQPIQGKDLLLDSANVAWGEWITLPPVDSNSILQAMVSVQTNPVYAWVKFFYKGVPLTIEYEQYDGTIITYNFSEQFAPEGLFVNPLLSDPSLNPVFIKRVRFSHEKCGYFSNKIKVVWRSFQYKDTI